MASRPPGLDVRGMAALQNEVGKGKIAEAAYNHMQSLHGPAREGWDFSLSFDLSFSLFDDEVAARE